MGDVSKQFSLREIVGNVAPGAMALSAILWVWLKVATLPSSGYPLGDVLIGFVLAYGAGTLLTSLTQNIFAAVIQFRTGSASGAQPQRLVLRRTPRPRLSERVYRRMDTIVRRAVAYLSGGQDIASAIREFRGCWEKKAVEEHVISEHALALAGQHYRTMFDADPSGEESLLFCELFIRDRMPSAMSEIEQNAAKAALMGNLILPTLLWVVSLGLGIGLGLYGDHSLSGMIRAVLDFALFGLLLVVFPYVARLIGRQWIEASRNHVRILLLTFVIACKMAAGGLKPAEAKSSASSAT